MRRRGLLFAVAAGSAAAAVGIACTLNPQPLPPTDLSAGENSDASADGGNFNPPRAGADAAGGDSADASTDAAPAAPDASDAAADADSG